MSRYIIRGRKFLLSLSGRAIGCGRDRRLYWMAGRSLHRAENMMGVTDYRLESAWAAMSLKEGASSGRKSPLLARRTKLSKRFRSLAQEPPPRWRCVHESADHCCPCNIMQGLPGHSSRLKGPQSIY